MSLDGLVLHALVHELQSCVGGRIHKIHQPFERDLVLQIRNRKETKKLLLSANPTYPRLHLTDRQFENPMEPPMFCMLMRKYCENGILESVEQVGLERIVHLNIRHRDELGDMNLKTVIVEMMGKHSNIVLTDPQSGKILDSIHHITPALSRYRVVMPGTPYTPPPDQGKANPLEMSRERFRSWLDEHGIMEESTEQQARELVSAFSGLSPLVAREMAHRGIESFPRVMEQIREHRYEPSIVDTGDGKSFFSVIELTHLRGTAVPFLRFTNAWTGITATRRKRI